MNTVTLYYVGENPTQALQGFPFDSWESAEEYRKDTFPDDLIYSVVAVVDESTMEIVVG